MPGHAGRRLLNKAHSTLLTTQAYNAIIPHAIAMRHHLAAASRSVRALYQGHKAPYRFIPLTTDAMQHTQHCLKFSNPRNLCFAQLEPMANTTSRTGVKPFQQLRYSLLPIRAATTVTQLMPYSGASTQSSVHDFVGASGTPASSAWMAAA